MRTITFDPDDRDSVADAFAEILEVARDKYVGFVDSYIVVGGLRVRLGSIPPPPAPVTKRPIGFG